MPKPRAQPNTAPVGGSPRLAWARVKAFCGFDRDTTHLWPRWLLLRAVGLIFIFVFAGILREGPTLVGPAGLAPLSGFFAQLTAAAPGWFTAFLAAPSLFWLGSGADAIALVSCAGLTAALALTLNLWPRVALLACWVCLLSFVTTWRVFSATQVDQLILETALLCVPFAPRGFRPGLGAASPPRPIALFALRWLLFRVMFESGLLKLIAGDERWLNLTAMDALYETAPFPTILGYYLHQLPHAFHVGEIALTFAAELAAPLLAVFAGRRGRWLALGLWTVFQAGIHFTNNFGWLNVASVALGLILLDDSMLAAAARRCGLQKFSAPPPSAPPPISGAWARHGLRVALAAHFALTLLVFFYTTRDAVRGMPLTFPAPVQAAAVFRSANAYTLYAGLLPRRFAVEFEGSADGGETWRAYDYRYQPQRENQISPFLAPWYARFEATLQVEANGPEASPLFAAVAAQLLARNPAVLARFRADPFPDRPATMIRIRGYQLAFVDLADHRATGRFWRKQTEGDYLPLMYLDARGALAVANSETDIILAHALHGNRNAQTKLGTLYAYGEGVPRDRAEAARWFQRATAQGHPLAQFFLGLSYAQGDGVPQNFSEAARFYHLAAAQDDPSAQLNLGLLHARGEGVPRDETEALAWFILAAHSGQPEAAKIESAFARRLDPAAVAAARRRSATLAAEIAARPRVP
jgi:hypothetical protein